MEESYLLLIDNQQAGPYTVQQIGDMRAAGTVNAATLCWKQGTTDWVPLGNIGALGAAIPPPIPGASTMASLTKSKTSGLAIWSLTLGILAYFCFSIFASIPAVICGHLALSKIKKSSGTLTGGGLAIAGLVLGYLYFLMIPVLVSIALPAFSQVQARALETKSLADGKQIGLACKLYANDNGGNFPPSLDALVPTYISDRSILASPLNPSDPEGYIYTTGLTDSSPSDTVLLEDKYGSLKHVRIVVFVDDSARVIQNQ